MRRFGFLLGFAVVVACSSGRCDDGGGSGGLDAVGWWFAGVVAGWRDGVSGWVDWWADWWVDWWVDGWADWWVDW